MADDGKNKNTGLIKRTSGMVPYQMEGFISIKLERQLAAFPIIFSKEMAKKREHVVNFYADRLVGGKVQRTNVTLKVDTAAKELPSGFDGKVLAAFHYIWEKRKRPETVIVEMGELLAAMNISPNGTYRQMVKDAIDRLSGLRLSGAFAFFVKQSKTPKDGYYVDGKQYVNLFKNIETRETKGGAGKFASFGVQFSFNDVIFKNILNDYFTSIDMKFLMSLKGDNAVRLYWFLENRKWTAEDGVLKYRLSELANWLPLDPNPVWRQLNSLKRAFEQLEKTHFFRSRVEFLERSSSDPTVVFALANAPNVIKRLKAGDYKASENLKQYVHSIIRDLTYGEGSELTIEDMNKPIFANYVANMDTLYQELDRYSEPAVYDSLGRVRDIAQEDKVNEPWKLFLKILHQDHKPIK